MSKSKKIPDKWLAELCIMEILRMERDRDDALNQMYEEDNCKKRKIRKVEDEERLVP